MSDADHTPEERLDRWLGKPAVRTRHRRTARTDPPALWECAGAVRLCDTRGLGRMVRWRIPGLDPSMTYHELFSDYPFTVLDEDDGLLISGLCGKIWTLARDYPRIADAGEFAAWHEPGTVRVVFAHWVRPLEDGAEIVSEARVEPTDRVAALRLRALWSVIGPFQRLAAEPLTFAARAAERGS